MNSRHSPQHGNPSPGTSSSQVDPNSQVHQDHIQHVVDTHSVDPNLSSIVAFNQSFSTAANNVGGITATTNEWGKRPADVTSEGSGGSDASKRPHLDQRGSHALTPEETDQIAQAHLSAHIAAMSALPQPQPQPVEPQTSEVQVGQEHPGGEGDDGDRDHDDEEDYEYDEDDGENGHVTAAFAAAHGQNPWGGALDVIGMDTFGLWDANQSMRIQSLPILDNLSGQILQTLGKGPYQDTINIVTQPESGQGQAYSTMKSLFDQTKKLYTQEAFLSADELKLEDADQRATIRKVNLATFVSSVFGSQEVGFFHLNENFLDTFVPDGGRLLKSQGSLYLDLKTQAFISAMSTNERTKAEILDDLFPPNMTEMLLTRRPGAKQLTPSEQDFVGRLAYRRNHLMQTNDDENLAEKYVWQDFLKEVNWYVSKNHEIIVAQPPRGGGKVRKLRATGLDPRPEIMGGHGAPMPHPPMPQQHNGDNNLQPHDQHAQVQGSPDHTEIPIDTELFGPNTSYMGAPPVAQPPVPQQSQPTQVLYERARLAATSKASPNARRAGLPSQRRPWSTEEENALMAGLDRVKGPHWSQILAMFGPGGTVSEALKDRNQVQLKDKARNLKLFFLKSGIEVPYYLQFVTGELKTRAPGQAAKNAAKKAVEASAEEDAAHVAAVTALGNVHRSGSVGDMNAFNTIATAAASAEPVEAGQVAPQAPMMGSTQVEESVVDPALRDIGGVGGTEQTV